MTNPTPVESKIGDHVCHKCKREGELTAHGEIGRCTRCGRRTYRQLTRLAEGRPEYRLTKVTGPDAKPTSAKETRGSGMVLGPREGAHFPAPVYDKSAWPFTVWKNGHRYRHFPDGHVIDDGPDALAEHLIRGRR